MNSIYEKMDFNLLIVQKSEDLAENFRQIASQTGMSVTIALSGGDSLVAVQSSKFDLCVISDSLPDMDIEDLILMIQKNEPCMPPFIVISDDSDFRHALRMLRLGARDFLLLDGSFKSLFPETLNHVRREVETEMKLRETEIALKRTERLYALIAENLTDVIFIYNTVYERFSYISPSIYRLCGYKEDVAVKMQIGEFIEKEEFQAVKNDMKERIAAFKKGDDLRKTSLYRVSVIRRKMRSIRVEILTTLVWAADGNLEILGVARDVEERARMEEAMLYSLREKEILLQEVHHRVKNNLQIIISLMNLQIRGMQNVKVAGALQDSQNRIRAMAMIHEQLYRSPSLADIQFPDYVKSFVPILMQCSEKSIDLYYDIENIALDLDFAVPCGLILNELITNSIKHAFTKVQKPEIRITFAYDEKNASYTFVVADNGPGLPYEIFPDSAKSLGFTLVMTLVGQLSGRMEIESNNGARFTMIFPANVKTS